MNSVGPTRNGDNPRVSDGLFGLAAFHSLKLCQKIRILVGYSTYNPAIIRCGYEGLIIAVWTGWNYTQRTAAIMSVEKPGAGDPDIG